MTAPASIPVAPGVDLEMERLRLFLRTAKGGSLSFALYSRVTDREAVARRTKKRFQRPFHELFLRTTDTDPVRALQQVAMKKPGIVFAYDLDDLAESSYRTLNLRREAFLDVPHAVVFWVREHGLRRVATEAPDLWRYESSLFDFRSADRGVTVEAAQQAFAGGFLYKDRAEMERRISLYEGLLKEWESEPPADAGLALEAMNQLGYGLHALGKWHEATEAWGQGLERARQSVDQANVATFLNNLGIVAQQQGALPEAERLYTESLDIHRGLGHQEGIAISQHNLGLLWEQQGRLREAATSIQEALEIFRRLGSPYAEQGSGHWPASGG